MFERLAPTPIWQRYPNPCAAFLVLRLYVQKCETAIRGKSRKCSRQQPDFEVKNESNLISGGALPTTPLGDDPQNPSLLRSGITHPVADSKGGGRCGPSPPHWLRIVFNKPPFPRIKTVVCICDK